MLLRQDRGRALPASTGIQPPACGRVAVRFPASGRPPAPSPEFADQEGPRRVRHRAPASSRSLRHGAAPPLRAAGEGRPAGLRTQVIDATGSGKTLIGVAAANGLTARRVLVLVPALDLLVQTAAAWRAGGRRGAMIGVCSLRGADSQGLPCTTDPDELTARTAAPRPSPCSPRTRRPAWARSGTCSAFTAGWDRRRQ
ncbi:DEAD/DEAH box helicase family protein [Streptomyces sp. NPDC093223]|uniref:DEAD/DEAH box helicase family protein n=1 Tax=Streptomyces sp. NPDC093223 TaxID=3366033 RepID=UPI0038118DF3